MLYREIIAVCSQIHTKHKYVVWAEGTVVTAAGGTYSYQLHFHGHLMLAESQPTLPVCPLHGLRARKKLLVSD